MDARLKKKFSIHRFIRMVAPLALIVSGGMAWAYFHVTAPRMEKKPPEPTASVVEIITVHEGDTSAVIRAMGTVVASREVTLRARVSGDVVSVSPNFMPGGHIAKGEEILRLDLADYEVVLEKAESALKEAMADLDIEEGNQRIAREELRLLSETAGEGVMPTDLTLRKPQLQKARAAVESAKADLRKARLDLERTVATSPFNAMIIEPSVNIGSHVSLQDSLVTIVDTDAYWVEAAIPADQLEYLDPKGNCAAKVRFMTGEQSRQGRMIRTTGKLSQTSRMAKVIVSVSDPLRARSTDKSDQMVLGDYVSVEIQGRALKSVIELPRSALHDDNTVWVYDDGKLDIRPVAVAWKEGERIFVDSGLSEGTQVVVSDLSLPVQGMTLKLLNEDKTTPPIDPTAPKAG